MYFNYDTSSNVSAVTLIYSGVITCLCIAQTQRLSSVIHEIHDDTQYTMHIIICVIVAIIKDFVYITKYKPTCGTKLNN